MFPVHSEDAPAAIGPYSQAIIADSPRELVFCSGQIPIDPTTGEVVAGDVVAQTHRVMENLLAVLRAAGCTFIDVVKTTIYLSDMDHFAPVNEAYGTYFDAHRPARATVEVSRLPKDVSVEIDAIAVRGRR